MGDISEDCFAFVRQLADVVADEFLEIGFAADKEGSTNTREFVRPLRCQQ